MCDCSPCKLVVLVALSCCSLAKGRDGGPGGVVAETEVVLLVVLDCDVPGHQKGVVFTCDTAAAWYTLRIKRVFYVGRLPVLNPVYPKRSANAPSLSSWLGVVAPL